MLVLKKLHKCLLQDIPEGFLWGSIVQECRCVVNLRMRQRTESNCHDEGPSSNALRQGSVFKKQC